MLQKAVQQTSGTSQTLKLQVLYRFGEQLCIAQVGWSSLPDQKLRCSAPLTVLLILYICS